MSYQTILPLEDVKIYLRVDEDFIDADNEIKLMRDASCEFVEKFTNHLLYKREKEYFKNEGEKFLDIFDYPIASESKPTDVTNMIYATKTSFVADSVVLQVGYNSKNDIPPTLLQLALQLIKFWYYDSEIKGNFSVIPEEIKNALFNYKRYIV